MSKVEGEKLWSSFSDLGVSLGMYKLFDFGT